MAASAWTVFNEYRKWIVDGTIDHPTTVVDLHLFTTAASANITNDALSTLGSIANEVASVANSYSQSGIAITDTWLTGDSAGQMRYDMSDVIVTASGANIVNIRYALLVARTGASGKDTANKVMMRAALTATQFTLNDGSTLTIATPAGDGIFELSGG
jgi:hypothetical protein